jgi:hypothetical protein
MADKKKAEEEVKEVPKEEEKKGGSVCSMRRGDYMIHVMIE